MLTRVVTVVEDLDDLDRTVASLDLQTVPTGAFEVDVLLGAVDARQGGWLVALASRRPALHLLSADGRTAGSLLASLAARAGADRVMVLPPGAELHAEALARLSERAEDTGADVVVGSPSGAGSPVVLADQERAVAAAADLPPDPRAALGRWTQRLIERARRLVRLEEYAAVRGGGLGGPLVAAGELRARWVGASLQVELGTGASADRGTPWVILRETASGAEHLLPTVLEPVPGAPGRVTAQVELGGSDPASGLPAGTWEVGVCPDADAAHAVALPRVPLQPAVVHGRAVATSRRDAVLTLQVGRVRALLSRTRVTGTHLEETHRGSLLRVALSGLHMAGAEPLPGRLVIGGLPVPALIRHDDTGPHLEAWVSGLAGTYELEAAFAATRARPLGLALVVEGDGTMRVVAPAESAPRKGRG